jgi:hypothetical protein
LADNVSVIVVDLFAIGISGWSKCDQAAGEMVGLEAVGVTDFIVDFLQALQRGVELDDFHLKKG